MIQFTKLRSLKGATYPEFLPYEGTQGLVVYTNTQEEYREFKDN